MLEADLLFINILLLDCECARLSMLEKWVSALALSAHELGCYA